MAKAASLKTRLTAMPSKLRTSYQYNKFNTGGKNTHFGYVGGIPKKGGK